MAIKTSAPETEIMADDLTKRQVQFLTVIKGDIMGSRIRDVYIIHHSHTDIGYTDLQEQVIYNQVNNIRNVVSIIKRGYETGSQEKDFKWNCETYFCVEQYLESASEEEKADFFDLVRKGNIGISATYLNGTDLTDVEMLNRKTAKMQETFTAQGLSLIHI